MRTSCINHPPRCRVLYLRDWQRDACEGDKCASMLLSYLEYWHNVRLDQQQKAAEANEVAKRHGEKPTQDTSLWQFHTTKDLEAGLLRYFKKDTISAAIKFLEKRGFIKTGSNPNPRYKFDKTTYFQFLPEAVNAWVKHWKPRYAESRKSTSEKSSSEDDKSSSEDENSPTGTQLTNSGPSLSDPTKCKITIEGTKECAASPSPTPSVPISFTERGGAPHVSGENGASSPVTNGIHNPVKEKAAELLNEFCTWHKRMFGFRAASTAKQQEAALSLVVDNDDVSVREFVAMAIYAWTVRAKKKENGYVVGFACRNWSRDLATFQKHFNAILNEVGWRSCEEVIEKAYEIAKEWQTERVKTT